MSDRVAVVSGGGRGIGRAICLTFGAEGRRVAVCDLRAEEAAETAAAIRDAGGSAKSYRVDVTDPVSVEAGHQGVVADFGPVEILVNCAGWDEFLPFVATDEAFWDRIIEINYKGVLRWTRRVLPAMLDAQFGRIVNIASDAGRVGSSLEAVYSGAKGGVIAFTKTIAREAAKNQVTANVVCPGPTDTQLIRDAAATRGEEGAARFVDALVRAIPMRRLGQPADIAAAVSYFASDAAGFTTGQTLSVSGGLTMA